MTKTNKRLTILVSILVVCIAFALIYFGVQSQKANLFAPAVSDIDMSIDRVIRAVDNPNALIITLHVNTDRLRNPIVIQKLENYTKAYAGKLKLPIIYSKKSFQPFRMNPGDFTLQYIALELPEGFTEDIPISIAIDGKCVGGRGAFLFLTSVNETERVPATYRAN